LAQDSLQLLILLESAKASAGKAEDLPKRLDFLEKYVYPLQFTP
jgi:hypothetical protein